MSVGEKVSFLNNQMEVAVGQVFENLLERKKTKGGGFLRMLGPCIERSPVCLRKFTGPSVN